MTSEFMQFSNEEAQRAQEIIPAHEVTNQSLDLFNGGDRGVESMSLEITDYEQLMDFHKRMDTQMKHVTHKIGHTSPTNLSYQKKENDNHGSEGRKGNSRSRSRPRPPSKELRACSTLSNYEM